MEKILDLAINNGLWAVLFLILLIYVLKDSRAREKKYTSTITTLCSNLSVVNEIKNDILDIKSVVIAKSSKSSKKYKKEVESISTAKSKTNTKVNVLDKESESKKNNLQNTEEKSNLQNINTKQFNYNKVMQI